MKNVKNILMIFSLLASVMLVGCQKFDELERKAPQNALRGDDVTDIDEDEDDVGITDTDEDEDEEASGKSNTGEDKGNGTINDDDEDEDEASAKISH